MPMVTTICAAVFLFAASPPVNTLLEQILTNCYYSGQYHVDVVLEQILTDVAIWDNITKTRVMLDAVSL